MIHDSIEIIESFEEFCIFIIIYFKTFALIAFDIFPSHE